MTRETTRFLKSQLKQYKIILQQETQRRQTKAIKKIQSFQMKIQSPLKLFQL